MLWHCVCRREARARRRDGRKGATGTPWNRSEPGSRPDAGIAGSRETAGLPNAAPDGTGPACVMPPGPAKYGTLASR